MKLSMKFIVVTILIGMLGLVGQVRAVFASQQMRFLVAAMPHPASKRVLVSRNSDCEIDKDREERQEAMKLRSFAKITQQQAKQAAEAALGEKATHVELENEDGNLVYEVLIGQTEVIVDAGNGRVLFIENENETEAFHPQSSIQVPKVDDEDDENRNKRLPDYLSCSVER